MEVDGIVVRGVGHEEENLPNFINIYGNLNQLQLGSHSSCTHNLNSLLVTHLELERSEHHYHRGDDCKTY